MNTLGSARTGAPRAGERWRSDAAAAFAGKPGRRVRVENRAAARPPCFKGIYAEWAEYIPSTYVADNAPLRAESSNIGQKA